MIYALGDWRLYYILLFDDLYKALIIFAANNRYTILKLY